MLIHKRVLCICSILICFFLSSCGKQSDIQTEANHITDAINSGDMNTLNTILFPQELKIDEVLQDYFEQEDAEGGIVEYIISKTSISLKSVNEEDNILTYKVTAPNLTNIFQDAMTANISDDEYEEYIYSYVDSAKKISSEVEVSYQYDNGELDADYLTYDFINGITGNMLYSYQELLNQMIKENAENGGQNE